MYKESFELCWGDLTTEAQQELLNVLGLASAEETNWDYIPITIIEAECFLCDRAKEIMSDYLDAEDAEDMLEQLRSLKTEGVVTENLYDYIVDNWNELLEEIKEDV